MQSTHLTSSSPLFQVYKPATINNCDADGQAGYLQLPDINRSTLDKSEQFAVLSQHSDFPEIKARFLGELNELKQLAQIYAGSTYDRAISTFYKNVEEPPDHFRDSFVTVYGEIRYLIHQVVARIKEYQAEGAGKTCSGESRGVAAGSVAIDKDDIALILHQCLNGMDHCVAGIHSRLRSAFLSLEAARDGLPGKLWQLKSELHSRFIQSFIVEQQRADVLKIPAVMEVHYFNSLHNLSCGRLGLETIEDPEAIDLEDSVLRLFLDALPVALNEYHVFRKLAEDLFDQLSACLAGLGVSDWLTTPFGDDDLTKERMEVLDRQWLQPVNQRFAAIDGKELPFWSIFENSTIDDGYCLDRCRERLLAWLITVFESASGEVFARLPGAAGSQQFIGTINHHFFWVFTSDQSQDNGTSCSYDRNNHTSLQLSHLNSIDFSSWPGEISSVLLAQAMEQTRDAGQIARFFLNATTRSQLHKTSTRVMELVHNQFAEKITNRLIGNEELADQIYAYLSSRGKTHLVHRGVIALERSEVSWLMDSSLLGSVLSRLKASGIDVSAVIKKLPLLQIMEFSGEDIHNLITRKRCQELFRRALDHCKADVLVKIVLTGHFDQEINVVSKVDGQTVLMIFAGQGLTEALNYLLDKQKVNIHRIDSEGQTALIKAVKAGHAECVRMLVNHQDFHNDQDRTNALITAVREGRAGCLKALLECKGIDVNRMHGYATALTSAVFKGDEDCLNLLLAHEKIDVNQEDGSKYRALIVAAAEGSPELLKLLLAHKSILVNQLDKYSWTALMNAAANGHADCLKLLLAHKNINVNHMYEEGWRALDLAAGYGHADCLKLLLAHEKSDLNHADDWGITALMRAADNGHADCLALLLEHKNIDVNQADETGVTALMRAADKGYAVCLKLLLAHEKMRVDHADNEGRTTLTSVIGKITDITTHRAPLAPSKTLTPEGGELTIRANRHPERDSLLLAYFDCVEQLLACESIDLGNHDLKKLARVAAINGHGGTLKQLLARKVISVTEKNQSGDLLLVSALLRGQPASVEVLLTQENGDIEHNYPMLLVRAATEESCMDCLRRLLTKSDIEFMMRDQAYVVRAEAVKVTYPFRLQDIDVARTIEAWKKRIWWRPHHPDFTQKFYQASARKGYGDCFQLLLAHGSDWLNEQDKNDGTTALIVASAHNHEEYVRLLLADKNIRINVKDKKGRTALMVAAEADSVDTLEVLLAHEDIDVDAKDKIGRTAMMIAEAKGHAGCYTLLENFCMRMKLFRRLAVIKP